MTRSPPRSRSSSSPAAQARARPAAADAAHARPVAARRHPRLRAERAGADRRRGDAARRDRARRSPTPDQMLAFEPPDWRGLLGDAGTARRPWAASLACNLSGPRRIKAGAARDHFLGFRAVSGRGESVQGRRQGGQERHRLRSAEADGRLLRHARGARRGDGQGAAAAGARRDGAALRARARRRGDGDGRRLASPHEVSGAAYLPAARASRAAARRRRRRAAARRARAVGRVSPRARCCAELAGDWRVDSARRCRLRRALARGRAMSRRSPRSPTARCGGSRSRRRAAPISPQAIARALDAVWFLDWGGGLVWLAVAGAERWRRRGDPRRDPRAGRAAPATRP